MLGQGKSLQQRAPDFMLADESGKGVTLNDLLKNGAVLLAFYPGDFTPVCTSQWCNYRDAKADFERIPIQVVGISANPPHSHVRFKEKYDIPFRLLSDPKKAVASAFGCYSLLMFGRVSRAVFIVNCDGVILYRYVEPTTLTARKSDKLIQVLEDLKSRRIL